MKEIPEVQFYQKLFAYNKRVIFAYFRSLSKIEPKLVTRNLEASHYSMKDIFLHILTVYNGWLNYNVYGRSSEIPHETEHNPKNYASMAEVGVFMRKVWKGVESFISSLDDGMLSKKASAPWINGPKEVRDVLMQVSFEEAHHIGEIIALMWKFDIEPPEMTWFDRSKEVSR